MESLQYITDSVELCQKACDAGVRWIQLRLKDVSEEEYLAKAKECRAITTMYNAKLIVNDNLEVAFNSNADGVHLGLEDVSIREVRNKVSKEFIVGGTANRFEHIIQHVNNGANYVGLGPYNYTDTKKNLSPILGKKGVVEILQQLHKKGIDIPVVAIGGIQLKDISDFKDIGINTIAVSGLISNAENMNETVEQIFAKLNYAAA